MSDYICEKCGNECELEEVRFSFPSTEASSKDYGEIFKIEKSFSRKPQHLKSFETKLSTCCGVGYYEKEDKKRG